MSGGVLIIGTNVTMLDHVMSEFDILSFLQVCPGAFRLLVPTLQCKIMSRLNLTFFFAIHVTISVGLLESASSPLRSPIFQPSPLLVQ